MADAATLYLYDKHAEPISYDTWLTVSGLADWVSENWRRKDEGIWEVRAGKQEFVYSKLMCWVAMDRALRLAEKRSFPADEEKWKKGSQRDLHGHHGPGGWSETRNAFVQSYGSDSLDAANLRMPLTFFLAPTDPRMVSTLEATMQPLENGGLLSNSLVYRYNLEETVDGLTGEEGTFNICTFWLVETLTRAGRHKPYLLEEARLIFERILGFANHLGLYAEEIGPRGEALGNFPQAFTHLALVSALPITWTERLGVTDSPAPAIQLRRQTVSNPQHSFDPERVPKLEFNPVLTGQKALVTGGSSGIGRAIAIGIARAGADVAVNYASGEDRAAAVVDEVEALGRKGIAVRADVSNEEQVTAMFARAQEELGALDILVNNAGLQRDARFQDMSLDDWNAVISVNLTGQFLCAREAVKLFLAQGVRPQVSLAAGKIIHISSVHEVIPWAGHVNYAASKGGVKLLMQSLAQELAPQRIRVNSIAPGAVRTPINTDAWQTPEAYSSLMELVPYRRIGEPEDIAHAAVWLASDAADYVNAATIFVDGGMAAYPGFMEGG